VNVATQVHALLHCPVRLSQMRDQVPRSLIVIRIRDSVFRNDYRLSEPAGTFEHPVQALGIDLPAILRLVVRTHFGRVEKSPREHVPTDPLPSTRTLQRALERIFTPVPNRDA
jgi:hypothetical protein